MTPPEMLAGIKVLVIDDNRTNRRILEGLLKSWGMKPTVVPGAEEALVALDESKKTGRTFQLIVTDMHMPKMDGFGLVEKIKGKRRLHDRHHHDAYFRWASRRRGSLPAVGYCRLFAEAGAENGIT